MKVFKTLLIFTVLGALFLFNPSQGLADVGGETPGSGNSHCIETCSVENRERDCATTDCDACYFCHSIWQNANSLEQFQETIKNARQTGDMPRERWAGDPESSVLSDTMNGLSTAIIGEVDWREIENAISSGNFSNIHASGAIGTTSQLIGIVINTAPASGIEYFADIGRNFGIVKSAHAQGLGFTQLSRLLPIWKASRNLAYFFFVIVFMGIGIAIMFRLKIDPKTVISIQNAIPKLIISLIFITFSYAIAGLIIDLVAVIINLGVLALSAVPGIGNLKATQNNFFHLDFGNAMRHVTSTLVTDSLALLTGNALASLAIIGAVGAGIGAIMGGPPGIVIGGVGSVGGTLGLLFLIFGIISLFLMIKLLFKLINIYVSIIILIITAPFIIMLAAFPGSKMGFGSWFFNLLKKVLVFPAISLAILVAILIGKQTGPMWTPPVLNASGAGLMALVSMGMLLVLNKIPDILESAFAGKPFPYGTAIGEALAPGPVKFIGGIGKDAVKKGVVGYAEPEITTFIGKLRRGRQETRTAGATDRAGNPPTG